MQLHDLHRAGLMLIAGYAIARFGGVLFKLICVNQMPPGAYGNVAVFLVLYNWLILIGTLGITLGLMRFVSSEPARKGQYYRASLLGCAGLSILVGAVAALAAPWLSGILNMGSASAIYFLAASLPFAAIYNLAIFYYRGRYRMTASVLADFLLAAFRVVALALLFFMALQDAPYIAFLVSFILLDVLVLAKSGSGNAGNPGRDFKILLIYSLPIFISEFLRFFAMELDRLLLSGFYGTAEAGLYDLAVSLCLGYVIIANSYGNALLPKAAGGSQGSLKRSIKGTAALYIIYTIAIILIARPLIALVNPAYMPLMEFLLPLMVSYIFVGALTLLSFFVNAVGRQRHAVYSSAAFAFLSLALNFYLVPSLKYMGAIEALIVSGAVSLCLLGGLVWREKTKGNL